MRHRRLLVTGAEGFLGRHLLVDVLQSADISVVGIGRSPHTKLAALATVACGRYEYAAIDVLDTARLITLLDDFSPTVIIHLASGLRDDPPKDLISINVLGTLSLLEAVSQTVIQPRVLIGSSGGVYGQSKELPLTEKAPCSPIDLYSVSKLAQENVAQITGAARGLDVVVARMFNLIGAGQDERHACSRFARQLAAVRDIAMPCVDVGDLSPSRDFIDVRDAARAMLHLAQYGRPGHIYNVASGIETSMGALLELTCAAAGLLVPPEIRRTYQRAADIPRHVADITKLKATGYESRHVLAQSVADLVAYYQTVA
jgi:nucleoside-diphosphate-sugar epimerase